MKTRAIFRWITSRIKYDVKGYMSGKPAECSAKAVLKSRCCVCEGYANLFFALAKEAKLEVTLLRSMYIYLCAQYFLICLYVTW